MPETKTSPQTPAPALVDPTGQKVATAATRIANEARAAGEQGTEATRRSAEVVGTLASRALQQGQEGLRQGLRVVAEAQRPVAERSYAQGQQAIEAAAQMTEAYRQAAERTAEDVQALAVFWTHFVRGAQQWQHAYFEMAQRSLQHLGAKPQDLLRATSPAEFAQIQRDLYVGTVSSVVTSSATLLQLAGQIVQDTVRPLQERARLHG